VSHVRSRGALLEIPFLVSFLDLLSCSFSFSRETGSIATRRISRPGSPDSGMTRSLGKHVGHSRLLGAMLPFDLYVPCFVRIRDHVSSSLSFRPSFPAFSHPWRCETTRVRSLGYTRHFALILFPRSIRTTQRASETAMRHCLQIAFCSSTSDRLSLNADDRGGAKRVARCAQIRFFTYLTPTNVEYFVE